MIVPILCVLMMHVTRLVKDRRNQGRQRSGSTSSADSRETLNQDQGIQTDAPPTYDQLFGSNFGSTYTLLANSVPPSTDIPNNNSDASIPSLAAGETDSVEAGTTTSGRLFSISDGQLENVSFTTVHSENETLLPQFRAPGMHISIVDLMTSHENAQTSQESPGTPDSVDSIQTPPPSYKDALALFGLSCSPVTKS